MLPKVKTSPQPLSKYQIYLKKGISRNRKDSQRPKDYKSLSY